MKQHIRDYESEQHMKVLIHVSWVAKGEIRIRPGKKKLKQKLKKLQWIVILYYPSNQKHTFYHDNPLSIP